MNPFQITGSLIDAGKALIESASINQERINGALSTMFTKQGLDSLAHGLILLSEEAIDRELRNLVGVDGQMKFGSIRCLQDHIEASVVGKKLTAEVTGEYCVRVQDIAINQKTQHLRMEILSESYRGKNFLGKCAIAVCGSLLRSMVRKEVSNSELGRVLEFEKEDQVILKLGELDAIKGLKGNLLPGVPSAALDLVHFTGASHVNGGIQIQLGRSEKFVSLIEGPLTLLKKTMK